MLTFTKKTDDRKALVKRLGELTGIKPHYNGMPDCTYTVGDYEVAKDGTITVEDEKADMEILSTLAAEELIEAPVSGYRKNPLQRSLSLMKMNISLPLDRAHRELNPKPHQRALLESRPHQQGDRIKLLRYRKALRRGARRRMRTPRQLEKALACIDSPRG
jgi:hypothetical protein